MPELGILPRAGGQINMLGSGYQPTYIYIFLPKICHLALGANQFLETRLSSESLKSLIGFLAYIMA